jgi:hypothetical protein
MSAMSPYAQIVGPAKIYLAAYGTAEPAVDATPGSSWVELGPTAGDQDIAHDGDLEEFRDNDHQGPVKVTRPDEDVLVHFTVVGLTLEHYARIINDVSQVTSVTSGAAAAKRLSLKRGFTPTEYALLIKGDADSPYGIFPGQTYIPRCVQASSPNPTRGKAQRAELECEFKALEDDLQSVDEDKLGWSTVQTS